MAADSGGRSGLGWVILIVALAVPGFLFYNWSSRLKAEHDRGISTKARTRLEGGVFQTPPTSARMVNPIATSTAAPAAAAAGAAVAAVSTTTIAAVKPALPVPANPALGSAAAPATPAAFAAAASTTAARPGASGLTMDLSTSAVAAIMLPRDPMLSPLDLVRMREIEEEKRRREEELRLAGLRGKRRAPRRVERPIESDVELQGIVAKPDGGNIAIINDEKVGPGTSFSVASHTGKVRVISISADSVTFQYGSHRFKKIVGKD